MLKKILLFLLVLLLVGVAVVWIKFINPLQEGADRLGPATAPRDAALQDDARITRPEPGDESAGRELQQNTQMKLYWGELHVHTAESFDASLFGNTFGVEDAYRFAKGEPLINAGGETMQLSRPLDFVAITDHAEGFGTRTHCTDAGLSIVDRAVCWFFNLPNPRIFQIFAGKVRGTAELGDTTKPAGVYQPEIRKKLKPGAFPTCKLGDGSPERCYENAGKDWARYIELADRHYEPGRLTTLIGYEFSPSLPDEGKHHRNVLFRTNVVPKHAVSSLDVPNAIELWKSLEADCGTGCDFLTIPHSSNKAWGLTYSRYTWDGKVYSEADWRLRQRREPLAEIFQIKGAQECALGVGATDEECAFAQVLDPCMPGEITGCAFKTGFVRQGLKVGLELEAEYGFNPLQVGFIAATDTHSSNSGDVEEWDFRGAIGAATSSAYRRLRDDGRDGKKNYKSILKFHTSGGLAAVWAPENTREAIFDALARRETYATSGPRIGLRFHAGWGLDDLNLEPAGLEEKSVAMGSVLRTGGEHRQSPDFYVWAVRDPLDAPLQRIQMVKGWVDDSGETHEKVIDIACADGLEVDPATSRCPDNGADVDLTTCHFSAGTGADELKVVWRDPQFDYERSAFYYVRVLMNPTCRWSTYDAIRLGREPDPGVPATIRERAWTSPIWVKP